MRVVTEALRGGGDRNPDFDVTVRFEPTQDDAAYRALLAVIFGPVGADERRAS